MTQETRTRSEREAAYAAIGPDPWLCFFCTGSVLKRGNRSEDCHAHHKDRNFRNNAQDNVVPAHARCHRKHHNESKNGAGWPKGKKKTPEQSAKTSAGLRGKPKSEEHKQRIRESIQRSWDKRKGKEVTE